MKELLEQISSFGITPLALFEDDYDMLTFPRMDAGIKQGKRPKYTEYFVYPTNLLGTAKPGLYATFVATLKDGQLKFVYKLFLDNRIGDVFSPQGYATNRNMWAHAKALRTLDYGRYIFAVNGTEHELTNVPLSICVSRSGCSAKKVKAPAVTP